VPWRKAVGDITTTGRRSARIVEDESERRRILAPIALSWRRNDSGLWADEARPYIETMVRMSPLIEVTLDRAA
jgi:hypothetical protein